MNYTISLERGKKLDYVTPVGRDAQRNFCIIAREATGVTCPNGQEGRRVVLIKLTPNGVTYQNLTPDNQRFVPTGATFDRVDDQGYSDPNGRYRDIAFGALNSDAPGAFLRNVNIGTW